MDKRLENELQKLNDSLISIKREMDTKFQGIHDTVKDLLSEGDIISKNSESPDRKVFYVDIGNKLDNIEDKMSYLTDAMKEAMVKRNKLELLNIPIHTSGESYKYIEKDNQNLRIGFGPYEIKFNDSDVVFTTKNSIWINNHVFYNDDPMVRTAIMKNLKSNSWLDFRLYLVNGFSGGSIIDAKIDIVFTDPNHNYQTINVQGMVLHIDTLESKYYFKKFIALNHLALDIDEMAKLSDNDNFKKFAEKLSDSDLSESLVSNLLGDIILPMDVPRFSNRDEVINWYTNNPDTMDNMIDEINQIYAYEKKYGKGSIPNAHYCRQLEKERSDMKKWSNIAEKIVPEPGTVNIADNKKESKIKPSIEDKIIDLLNQIDSKCVIRESIVKDCVFNIHKQAERVVDKDENYDKALVIRGFEIGTQQAIKLIKHSGLLRDLE